MSQASVVIASKNRPDYLERLIASLRRQTLAPAEIIVVDDGSTPPLPDLGVDLQLRNEISGGCCMAHNCGLKVARSPYIFIFDDDVELQDITFLSRALALAQTIDGFGALGFPQNKSDGTLHWMQPANTKVLSQISTFFGYAVLFRKSALDKSGLYFEPIQFYYDENELSLRLIDSGFIIAMDPDLKVTHHEDPRGRNFRLIHRLCWRNVLYAIFVRHPVWLIPFSALLATYRWIRLAASWKHFEWGDLLWGLQELRKNWPVLMASRAPVRFSSLKLMRDLQRRPRPLPRSV